MLSVQIRLNPVLSRRRLALRVTLFRLLAHLHGLGPAAAGFDLRRAITMPLRLDNPAVYAIAHRYLRAGFETLGAGRRTVLDEVAMTVAQLNAACVLAGRHAAANEKRAVDAESFTQGLLESADLSHADAGGRLSASSRRCLAVSKRCICSLRSPRREPISACCLRAKAGERRAA